MVSCDSGHGVRNAIYLINSKILLTKPHSGIAVLMLSYLLPIRWQCHAVVSDHTVSKSITRGVKQKLRLVQIYLNLGLLDRAFKNEHNSTWFINF